MKKLLILSSLLLLSSSINAQRFEDYFEDRTLRLDYTFAGDNKQSSIYVDELVALPRWYGKRQHLNEVPLRGNGQIIMRPHGKEEIIFRHSFSTLFQEWLSTEEAKQTKKSFENVFLVPFPKDTVEITVELYDYHDETAVSMTHTVVPTDILIRQAGEHDITPYDVLHQAADTARCIRIAFVARIHSR
jgi:hypothetical protein